LGLGFSLLARAAASDGPTVHSPVAVPLWLAGIGLTLAGFGVRRAPPIRPSRSQVAEVGLVLLLIGAAFGLRAWGAASFPHVLSGDEGSVGLTGWEFVTGQRDNPLSLAWFSFPALYFWIVSWFQILLGRSIEAIRWSSALAGALSVGALYVCARQLFGRALALAASAWLCAFHLHVFFGRVAYNNVWDGLLFTIAIAGLWIGWRDGRRWGFLLAGLASGFSLYFYVTAKLTPVLLALWSLVLWRTTPPAQRRLEGLVATGWVAGIVGLPLALLYLSDPASLFFHASRVSILVPGVTELAAHALGTTTFGLVMEQVWITALGLVIAELQGVYFRPGVPMLFGLSALLFGGGFAVCLARLRDPRYAWMLMTLAATLVVGGLSIQAPNAQRMLLLPPVAAILVALPLEEARRRMPDVWPARQVAGGLAMAAFILPMMVQNLDHLFRVYAPHEAYGSLNAEVAQEMGRWASEEAPGAEIFFVGGERMGVHSVPNLPYLFPSVRGQDLLPPFVIEDAPPLAHLPRLFIVLPEQAAALYRLQASYGPGTTTTRYNRDHRLLFYAYLVR
jgi:4-amino-4-deoxy-L-arabinose transferase-like glycosyltransferase